MFEVRMNGRNGCAELARVTEIGLGRDYILGPSNKQNLLYNGDVWWDLNPEQYHPVHLLRAYTIIGPSIALRRVPYIKEARGIDQ
ncbi:14071_t:CDS:2 [Acaulospora colombiana]|uniref:14071_t:CDS:1 n=1 Tax=Acaulospora colombiana TaxID=27376 RepID=A0ACA9K1V6_9GLOM|nr:14071_t:CDS:2 [Acaulospora colombiana]